MESVGGRRGLGAALKALKMRLYLSVGFGYSKLFPAPDAVLIRADKTARRRATFIQRLAPRAVTLAAVGLFFYFLVAESSAGLMIMLLLFLLLIPAFAALVGAFVATRVDSTQVCLRREYKRLKTGRIEPS